LTQGRVKKFFMTSDHVNKGVKLEDCESNFAKISQPLEDSVATNKHSEWWV
jgi:hypothetical protein